MDLQWLIPLGTFLGVVGPAAGFLITRADKKREAREAQVIETLKERIAQLEAEKLRDEAKREAERKQLERKVRSLRRTAGQWRDQLLANNLTPDPAEWPEEPDEQ